MAIAKVYKAQTQIDSRKFSKEFMIVEADHSEIIWSSDGEPAPRKDRIESILIWVKAGKRPPEIDFVPPEWELIVDGQTMLGKNIVTYSSRTHIPVKGSIAELRYDDLRFVFRFSDW